MSTVVDLVCVLCNKSYAPEADRFTCDDDGEAGTLDVRYDYDAVAAIGKPQAVTSMWDFRPLLALQPETDTTPLTVGGTPLYHWDSLAHRLGIGGLWIKDEGRQPTASLKDRASAHVVAKAQEFGRNVITTASTGNAAAALAGISAAAGADAKIFVPASAPQAKVAQLLTFGATVFLVNGSYNDAFDLCTDAAAAFGWYSRNTGVNPYTTDGKKTASLEIIAQLGWEAPDAIFVSVGDGSIISGLHKGLVDAHSLGWIDSMPRLYGIQAAGSDYLVQAFESGEDVVTKQAIPAATVADSISADLPRDRVKAMRAVRETSGAYVRIEDDAILAAIPALARATGVFAEPAAAAAYAGLLQAIEDGLVGSADRVVVVSTGNGLKDVPSAMKAVERTGAVPTTIEPSLDSLNKALSNNRG